MEGLVQAAKANPGKLNYGSAGVGSSQHMAAAMFKKLAGIDVAHIPFKGTAPALTELMAGRVDMVITTGAIPFVRSGKLRALAVAAHRRLPALPDVPTFEQIGVAGFFTDNWYGLTAPAKTPLSILKTLNSALAKALLDPEVQRQFVEQGAFPSAPMLVDIFWGYVRKQMPDAAELCWPQARSWSEFLTQSQESMASMALPTCAVRRWLRAVRWVQPRLPASARGGGLISPNRFERRASSWLPCVLLRRR